MGVAPCWRMGYLYSVTDGLPTRYEPSGQSVLKANSFAGVAGVVHVAGKFTPEHL